MPDIEEQSGIWVIADVEFDTSDIAQEAQRLAREGKLSGISADIADVTANLEVLDVDEFGQPTDWLETMSDGEIIGATQLPMPAFGNSRIIEQDGKLVAYVVPELSLIHI